MSGKTPFFMLISPAKNRRYKFPYETCVEVMSSLEFDSKGYKKIKAVCSDGRIRPVMLYKNQRGFYLHGYVNVRNVAIIGWVDTSESALKFTNAGIIFIPDPKGINCEDLPSWTIPGWSMPGKKGEIR